MIVIADTTPLNHLILVDQVGLLKAIYGRVIVPQAVFSELQDEAAHASVKTGAVCYSALSRRDASALR